jgi:hypothetical protein
MQTCSRRFSADNVCRSYEQEAMSSGLRWCTCHGLTAGPVLLLVLLAASQASAEPWTIEFGNCTFYGDTAGAPLVREGSCPSEGDTLDLSSKGITALEVNAFKGMTQLR